MKKLLSNKHKIISILLTISVTTLSCNGITAFAVVAPEDAFPHHQVQTFSVASKNTITGEVTTKEYDTSITTAALNRGETVMSTPAFTGTASVYEEQNILNEVISPKNIIGEDNRRLIPNPQGFFPYRAICRIVSYWDRDNDGEIDNTVGVGTGFLEGPSAVVTAGHCIYDAEDNMWCEYAKVTFAQNGPNSSPYGVVMSTTIHTSVAWIESGDENQDWAVVEIEEAVGNETGWFGKKWTSASLNNTSIRLAGYPGDIATSLDDKNKTDDEVPDKGKYMWTSTGKITESLDARLRYNADSMGGMSGCPVYNTSNQVLAIHAYGGSTSNSGTRITEWLYNFLEDFRP